MRITSVDLINYKGLGCRSIQFEDHLIMFVGKNGSGKTSVLTSVATALSWIVARLKNEKGSGWYIDEQDISNGKTQAMLRANFDLFSIEIPNKAKAGINKKYSLNVDEMKDYILAKRADFESTNFNTNTPVFVYYGVKRAVIDIPLRARDANFTLMDTYTDCLNGRSNFRNFFSWFRNQEDLENEYRLKDGAYELISLKVFRKAIAHFMPDYKNIQVKRNPLRMVVEKDGKTLCVGQLSDGEKTMMALIGDLCQRLVLANPTLEDPLLGEGIVLIDEIDLHLHPEWQGVLADGLPKVFRNVQFIVSTHSPHAVNHIATESVRILESGELLTADYAYGMPSLIVLQDVMKLKEDEPKEVVGLKSDFYSYISNHQTDYAIDAMTKLANKVPGHPELVRMRKIVERITRG